MKDLGLPTLLNYQQHFKRKWMEMLIIPSIRPYLERTGISRSKYFPCRALFTLETNINTIRFQYQPHGKISSQGQRKPFINPVSRAMFNTFPSRLGRVALL